MKCSHNDHPEIHKKGQTRLTRQMCGQKQHSLACVVMAMVVVVVVGGGGGGGGGGGAGG